MEKVMPGVLYGAPFDDSDDKLHVKQSCIRIVHVCRDNGVEISLEQARQAWRGYSDGLAARWMILPESDERLFSEVSEYLPGGKFENGVRKCSKCRGGSALPEMTYCLGCTRDLVRWVGQTVHNAYHEGEIENCRKSTCDAILKALGKR